MVKDIRRTKRRMFAVSLLIAAPTIATPAQPSGQDRSDVSSVTASLAIEPLTKIEPSGSGYFEDPYPVRFSPSQGDQAMAVSGTTKAIINCRFPLSSTQCSWTKADIRLGSLAAEITAANDTFTNFQNLNVFQDDRRNWHSVLAVGVKQQGAPDNTHWTVLVHARPVGTENANQVPLQWTADTILSGSFSDRVDGNYDGKYFEDDEKLYLLYVKNFAPRPALRNGIVIQPMVTPTEKAPMQPTTLLTTGDRFGPLNSERYDGTQARLVEAPYIERLGGKYALIYSTGAYQHLDYKAGVAWSDTLLPVPGKHYRKVLLTDPSESGQATTHPEVRYLLQSQRHDWPNFTPRQVFGPGVASVVRSPEGHWSLIFAGYDNADRPTTKSSVANAKHRRPYVLPLRVSVPSGQTVAATSDADLAGWITPETK